MINRFRLPDCIYEEIYAGGERSYQYCCKEKSRLSLRLFIPRAYRTLSIRIRIYRDETKSAAIYGAEGVYEYSEGGRDVYSFFIPKELTETRGIFFYDYYRISYDHETAEYPTGGGDIRDGEGLGQILTVGEDMMKKEYIPVIYHVFVDRFNRAGNEPPKDYAEMHEPGDEIPEYWKHPGFHIKNE